MDVDDNASLLPIVILLFVKNEFEIEISMNGASNLKIFERFWVERSFKRGPGTNFIMDETSGSFWLQEIESVDYWGPTFRAIYESGVQEAFIERLEKRIAEHDAEIEKMCNYHYQVNISMNLFKTWNLV